MSTKKSIYIADDNASFAQFCADAASIEGWQPQVCGNGMELVSALQQGQEPALVIIDINMPEMDGIEVIEEIRTCPRDLTLRFITGGAESSAVAARMIAKAHGLKTGAVLTKPMSLQRLRNVLVEETA